MSDIEMVSVKSTSIRSTGYDKENQILRVRFLSGLVYDYLNVPEDVFEKFLLASSKGTFLNQKIKTKYKFRKIK